MATFTMELRDALELEYDPGWKPGFEYDRDFDPSVEGAGRTIGLGSFPIFDESHREVLLGKIVDRYWTRELGQETVSMFRFQMRRKMNEIMPFYNDMYRSQLIEFDPLATFNLQTIRNDKVSDTRNGTSGSTSTSDTTSKSRSQTSDTPQNELPDDWMEDAEYATNGAVSGSKTDATAGVNSTETSAGQAETDGSTTTKGFQGSAADLLRKYRDQIINVDVAILDELSTQFHGVWDNGEEMQPQYSHSGFTFGYPILRDGPVPDLVPLYDRALEQKRNN